MSNWGADDQLNYDLNRHYNNERENELLQKEIVAHVKETIKHGLEDYLNSSVDENISEFLDEECISDSDYELFNIDNEIEVKIKVKIKGGI